MNTTNFTTFIGIDQSLNSTGYYASATNKGTINPRKTLRDGERLLMIHNYINALIEGVLRHKKIGASNLLLCMEGYAYNYRVGRVFELGEVGGIVKLICARLGVTCVSVPPGELKRFVTGRSTASKAKMMEAMDETQDDIADAKGLYYIAEGISKRTNGLKEIPTYKRCQLEVIHNCIKNSSLK